jgi:hypothetical protein
MSQPLGSGDMPRISFVIQQRYHPLGQYVTDAASQLE